MAWNDNLSGVPFTIASTPASPLRVMAGPGTGKSYAMKRRVARLIEADGVDPNRILAVTFTRTAANDLIEDLRGLGLPGCDEIQAGTLHGFCFRLLNREQVFAQTGRTPRPLFTFRKSGVLKFEAAPLIADLDDAAFGAGRAKTERLLALEAHWARQQDQQPGYTPDPVDRRFRDQVVDWMRFHNAMLIGELVPVALDYLKTNPTASVLSAFDHVVVDEYQDLNRAEQDLIDLLAAQGDLSIVGDENQSIYRFRHANPQGIVTFHTSHPGTHDESLNECRRCPTNVVAMADYLIAQNHPTTGPFLQARMGNPPGDIHIVQWQDLDEEIEGVASYVEHCLKQGLPPREVLVLSPRKHIGYAVRDKLAAASIQAHSFYHEEALETDEAQEAFALLTLNARPNDRVALRYWLGRKSTSFLRGSYAKLRAEAEASGKEPRRVLEEILAGTSAVAGTGPLVAPYQALLARLGTLSGLKGNALVDALFPPTQDWAAAMRECWATVADPTAEPGEVHDKLRSHMANPEIPEGDYVRIMSLHKSKGLSAKLVIVMSCVDGLVPFVDRRATVSEAREIEQEQRRLFYVALTRTREVLVVSSFSKVDTALAHRLGMKVVRGRGGGAASSVASPFLSQLGPSAPTAQLGTRWRAAGYK